MPTPMTLLLRLREDLDEDWRTFFGIYGPMVLEWARRRHHLDATVAEEVMATVMSRLVQKLRTGFEVDHQRGRFRSYVATLTNNAVMDLFRRRRGEQAGRLSLRYVGDLRDQGGPAESGEASDELAELERSARLQHCLDCLRDDPGTRRREWVAFERYVLNDEPTDVVARDLELTPARVYSIKHRMLQRIRTRLAQLERELGEV